MVCDQEWLASLKVGDEVIVDVHFRDPEIAKIDRFTKTQIIVGKMRFRKSDGWQPSGDWISRGRLVTPTAKLRAEAERSRLLRVIERRRWKSDTLDTLRKVAAILETLTPTPKETR